MNCCDRVRRIAILCHHCVRNAAYHRAGWVDNRLVSDDEFWRNANGNFLDIAILEWCKLFDWKGKHHWSTVICKAGPRDKTSPEVRAFLSDMLQSADISEEEFAKSFKKIMTYRNKFVAHIDNDKMGITKKR